MWPATGPGRGGGLHRARGGGLLSRRGRRGARAEWERGRGAARQDSCGQMGKGLWAVLETKQCRQAAGPCQGVCERCGKGGGAGRGAAAGWGAAACRAASGPEEELERTGLRKGRAWAVKGERGWLKRRERGPPQRWLLRHPCAPARGLQGAKGLSPQRGMQEGEGHGVHPGAPCLSALPTPRPATSGNPARPPGQAGKDCAYRDVEIHR